MSQIRPTGPQAPVTLLPPSVLLPHSPAEARKPQALRPQRSGDHLPAEAEHFNKVQGLPVSIHWSQRFRNADAEAPRIPAGYAVLRGALGTYTPFELNGKSYLALNEYHSHYAGREQEPPRQIYAITVFQRN